MKTYLLDTFNRYKRYSEKLDAKTVLCNKCWWVFNDVGEKETYIFKEDGSIIISISGAVTYGKWEYIPVNKSIIISGNNQSFMVLPSFVDEYILALQVDGTNNFAFLIDEQNKSKFAPKTYQDVIGYFVEKERRVIEAKKKEEQRLLEAKKKEEQRLLEEQRQREIEAKRKRQEELTNKNKNDADELYSKWNLFGLPLIFSIIGVLLFVLLINDRLGTGKTLSVILIDILQYFPSNIWIILSILYLVIRTPFLKWKIRRYIKKHPNDPVNPFLKEQLKNIGFIKFLENW